MTKVSLNGNIAGSKVEIQKTMNPLGFFNHFSEEESCELFLKDYRQKSGIYCKTYEGFRKYYWFSEPTGIEMTSGRV